ncbi:MFS transporter [Thermobifida halotolerans]|uniref:MFS transporter n=1 Tax=Thermobifida halotolerans TaxID=483545 RepID=A0AA97M570_9ACTN|nr:MFS transporter [Thermobifida halotolerans]UOE20740.1 MFS transporter [Thermobifida halotolerans]
MPKSVYLMALGIFAMVTSELLVSGLMPQMSEDLGATIPQIGYLVTAFALAMALGGPIATVAVLRLRTNHALLVLFVLFFAGNALAAAATSYWPMVVARIVTGAASGAFFGVALSAVAQVTQPHLRGRATGVALQGLMVGTLLGLPLSTLIGEQFGWRAAFVAVGALTVVVAVATMIALPRLDRPEDAGQLRSELTVFRRPRLWFIMATSTLIIGATFAAFSYFAPILTEVTGFSRDIVPLLLLGYGAATVVGNIVVGRLALSHTITVIVTGLVLNTLFLVTFALFADIPALALLAMVGIGLVGITLNPAMITRVQRAGNARALVNTLHSSFITMGVVVGSAIGGLGIDTFGLRAPLWVGATLAVLALAAMVPAVIGASTARRQDIDVFTETPADTRVEAAHAAGA